MKDTKKLKAKSRKLNAVGVPPMRARHRHMLRGQALRCNSSPS